MISFGHFVFLVGVAEQHILKEGLHLSAQAPLLLIPVLAGGISVRMVGTLELRKRIGANYVRICLIHLCTLRSLWLLLHPVDIIGVVRRRHIVIV